MSYPNLTGLLQMLAEKDEQICKILSEVDEEAKKYVELKATSKSVAEQVEALEIDAELCQQVANGWQANMKKRRADHELATECYDNTLVLTNIIKYMDLSKITKCDVLEKQMSKQSDWHVKEQLFKRIYEQHTTMENRNIVRELRKVQKENLEATKAMEKSDLEISQLKEHWDEKINDVTNQRNAKIVSLVKGSKELIALREKTNITDDTNQHASQQLVDIAMEVGDDNLASSLRFFPNVNNFFDEFNSSSAHIKENISNKGDTPDSLVLPTIPIHSTLYTPDGPRATAEPVAKKKVHFQLLNDSKCPVHNIMESTTEMEMDIDVVSEENASKNEKISYPIQLEQQQQQHRNDSIPIDGPEIIEKITSNEKGGAVAQLLFEKPKVISNILLKPANKSQPTDPARRITDELKTSNTFQSPIPSMQPMHFEMSSNPSVSNIGTSIPKSFDIFREMFQIPTTNTSIDSEDSNNNDDNEENNSSLNFEDTENNIGADDFFFDLADNDGKSDVNNSYL